MAKGRQSINNSVVIMEPTEMDVLCSKDKSVAKHPGNVVFRERIEQGTKTYSVATNKQEKMKITRDIVSFMQVKHGSRFLKKEGNVWVEINNQTARDKVSHALRFAAKQLMAGIAPSTTKKSPKTTSRSSRKRSVCSLSSSSSHSSNSSQSSVSEEEGDLVNMTMLPTTTTPYPTKNIDGDLDVEVPVSSIYMRQQNILDDLQRRSNEGHLDYQAFQALGLLQADLPTPEFNTLRSEDLDELMREPMFSSANTEEWDVVEQMAAC